jgi:hypothetical protein
METNQVQESDCRFIALSKVQQQIFAAEKKQKNACLTHRNLALDIYRSIQWQVMQTLRLRVLSSTPSSR